MIGPPPAGRSQVVLIGSGTYRHLSDLPAVANNLTDLAGALREPALWGIPADNCRLVPGVSSDGTTSVPEVIEAVRRAAREVGGDGLLLIYYAGHGLIDPDSGRLHLAVTGSEPGEEDATAVAYESIRRRVWQSRAAYKLVILDCCYAGRALLGEMSGAGLAEDVEIDQSVIIAATSRNLIALAPPGARHTAFTGELLTVLRKGMVNGPPVLDSRTIWREVLRAQIAKGLPRPEFRSRNAADDIPLVHNAWQPAAEPAGQPAASNEPDGTPEAPPARPATPPRIFTRKGDKGAVLLANATRSALRLRRYSILGGVVAGVAILGSVFLPKWWPDGGSDQSSLRPSASPSAGAPSSVKASPKPSHGEPSLPDPELLVSAGYCADPEISVVAIPASTTVQRGASLSLTMTIKNVSARTCARDVGSDAQEIYLTRGAERFWSSDTCGNAEGTDVRQFAPGSQREYRVTWNGRQSTKCTGNLASGPNPPPGQFELRARLGARISNPVALTIIA